MSCWPSVTSALFRARFAGPIFDCAFTLTLKEWMTRVIAYSWLESKKVDGERVYQIASAGAGKSIKVRQPNNSAA